MDWNLPNVQMKLTLSGPYCQVNVLWPNEFTQQEIAICDCPFGGSIDMCTTALYSTANHVRLNAPVPYKQDGWGACVILYATCKGCSNYINRDDNKPYKLAFPRDGTGHLVVPLSWNKPDFFLYRFPFVLGQGQEQNVPGQNEFLSISLY